MVINEHYTPQEIFEKLGDFDNEEKFRVKNKLLREMFVAAKFIAHLGEAKISAALEPSDVQIHLRGISINFQVASFFGIQRENGIIQTRRPHEEYKTLKHPELLQEEEISSEIFEGIDATINNKREKRYCEPINLLLHISYPNFWLLQNNFDQFVKKIFITLKESWLKSITIIWGNEVLCFPGNENYLYYIISDFNHINTNQSENYIYFCPLIRGQK